jgi:hypothetical protein
VNKMKRYCTRGERTRIKKISCERQMKEVENLSKRKGEEKNGCRTWRISGSII